MAGRKTRVEVGNHYQRLLAAERLACMLVENAFDASESRVIAIRIESDDHPEWDDIVEIMFDSSGTQRERAWQVKRVASLDEATLETLLSALYKRPDWDAILAFREAIKIPHLGNVEHLRNLCDETRKPGAILTKMVQSKAQEKFWDFAAKKLSIPSTDLPSIFRRLDVRFTGDESTVKTRTRETLLRLYDGSIDEVVHDLESFVAELGHTQRVDIRTLEQRLVRFDSQRRPTPRTLRLARTQYLDAITRDAATRLVVHGLPMHGLEVRLRDVWLPVRFTRDQAQTEPSRSAEEWLHTAKPGMRLILLGEPGAGKSEQLLKIAENLALKASEDAQAPIPVLVTARDLLGGLESAIRVRWPLVADQALQLLSNPGRTRFIVLVDGLDEAGDDAIVQIELVEQKLGNALNGLLMTSRPVLRWRAVRAEELWFRRWDESEYVRYLELWKSLRPAAVEAMQKSPHRSALKELLGNPLTATLCLSIAEKSPDALRSRAELYGAVVEQLVGGWAEARVAKNEINVVEIMTALQSLALSVIRKERQNMTERDIQQALQRKIRYRTTLAAKAVEVHLGVLVRRGDGTFDFGFRGLCEYLAARALLEQGDEQVIEAARHAWGQEVARHAIGWAVSENQAHGYKLMKVLLENEEEDDCATTNTHLRPVLVAIRTAGDLRRLPTKTAEKLFIAAWRRLVDETSSWVGNQVADAVQEWLRGYGPGSNWIGHEVFTVLRDKRHYPALWHAAQSYADPGSWMALMYHGDENVRSLAAEKLTPWVNDPLVRTMLIQALMDYGTAPGGRPVTMAAGLALRRAARDEHFAKIKPTIDMLLNQDHWLYHQTGAALALLPGEAEIEKLVIGLRHSRMGSGFPLPGEVFEALAKEDEGPRLLDQHIPDWKSLINAAVKTRHRDEDTHAEFPPSTWAVRRRLGRAIIPMLRSTSKEIIDQLQATDGAMVLDAACELAFEYPRVAVAALENAAERNSFFLWDDSALLLGRAARRHSELRKALLELWRRSKAKQMERGYGALGDFPGRALEELIAEKDPEAISVYKEWLQWTNHSPILSSYRVPLCDGLDVPDELRAAACPVLEGLWQHAIDGRVNEKGERSWLDPSVVGSSFFRLSSFWAGDDRFQPLIEGWLDDGDSGHFFAAIWALQRVAISESWLERIPQLLPNALNQMDMEMNQWRLLQAIELAGLSRLVLPVLEAAMEIPPFGMLATALVLPFHSLEQQRKLSAQAAKTPMLIDSVLPHVAERLVTAAPDAWARALRKLFENGGLMSGGDWLRFVQALPMAYRRQVVKVWASSAMELPWVQDARNPPACIRPADRARGLLFELGVDEPASRTSDDDTSA